MGLPQEVECSVPVGLGAFLAPPPPWLTSSVAAFRSTLCELWWSCSARAIAIDNRSCRSHERSRRSRRRLADVASSHANCSRPLESIFERRAQNRGTLETPWLVWWVWLVWLVLSHEACISTSFTLRCNRPLRTNLRGQYLCTDPCPWWPNNQEFNSRRQRHLPALDDTQQKLCAIEGLKKST